MVTPGQLKRRAALFEQLAAMIAAGVPLPKAMEMAARNRSIGISQKVIRELTNLLQEGHTFTDAMQLVSGQQRNVNVLVKPTKDCWLADFDIALLSAGEESGRSMKLSGCSPATTPRAPKSFATPSPVSSSRS
jgi:hypothetical protein